MRDPFLSRHLAALTLLVAVSACAPDAPVPIGFVGALTGRAADIGESSRNAVQLVIEQRNAEGGLRGRPIELVVRNDQTTPDGGASAAERLLAPTPDTILMVANAVDVARLAQQVRKSDPGVPQVGAEWARSGQLIEMGGRAIEGLERLQTDDPENRSPRYLSFRKAYVERLPRAPGHASVDAHDAATVARLGLSRQKAGEAIKRAIMTDPEFEGLQQEVRFDRLGDAMRTAVFVRARDGRFVHG